MDTLVLRLPFHSDELPPEWQHENGHQYPHGSRWRHPSGNILDFHQGVPGKPGWRGKDHWHLNEGKTHLQPGDEILFVGQHEREET